LAEVFDWAERNTLSAILSCLAAHASVQHSDGIRRHRLPDKQFGVFEFAKSAEHPLLSGIGHSLRFCHSRWNKVQSDALKKSGYTILTESNAGGVDTFVKKKGQSLFVHFQGHPEYGAETLLKEYRRDIRRFLRQERDTYPSLPKGYFDAVCERLVTEFRDSVLSRQLSNVELDKREELMEGFPDSTLTGSLQKVWHSAATTIYGNWLRYMISQREDSSKLLAKSTSH
jgi:homoserine O-succinyltransferase